MPLPLLLLPVWRWPWWSRSLLWCCRTAAAATNAVLLPSCRHCLCFNCRCCWHCCLCIQVIVDCCLCPCYCCCQRCLHYHYGSVQYKAAPAAPLMPRCRQTTTANTKPAAAGVLPLPPPLMPPCCRHRRAADTATALPPTHCCCIAATANALHHHCPPPSRC